MYLLIKIDSKEFIDKVKIGDNTRVRELLKLDRNLVFEYDHFQQNSYHWACKRGLLDTLEFLIIFGGKHLNLYDMNKRTPLYYAAKYGHSEVCKFLLENGANINLTCRENKRPIDVATDENIKLILKMYSTYSTVENLKQIFKYHNSVNIIMDRNLLQNQRHY